MGTFTKKFSPTLGKKIIISLTGLFLCLFLIVHLIGNLQLFRDDSGEAFNSYSYFMTHFLPIKIVSYILYASIIIHAVDALLITRRNKKARPIAYAQYNGAANSSWSSRNMGILGTILLIFIVVHMSNFWAQYHWGGLPYTKYEISLSNPKDVTVTDLGVEGPSLIHADYVDTQKNVRVLVAKDLYKVVQSVFQQWWYVALYVIAMAALSFHLIHGFRSAFQTLGWDHKKYVPIIRFLGLWLFAVIIPIAFAAMPLFFYFFK